MVGKMLRASSCFQYIRFSYTLCGNNFTDPKYTLRQGAGLIKDYRIHLVEGFQEVTALHQHTMSGGCADAAEEGQRNGKYQGAGTGHNQEHKGSADPFNPRRCKHQGRNYRQQRRQNHHRWGIDPGKGSDKILRGSFAAGGIFHHIDDLCYGRFCIRLGDLDGQHAAFIDAAGEDFIHGMDRPGHGFTGKSPGIHHGIAHQHHTIQRNLLAGFYQDPFASFHILRRYAHISSVSFHRCGIRADIHEIRNGLSGAGHRQILEKFAHLIKEHHRHRLWVFSNKECADGGKTHKKVFVKHMAFDDVFYRAQHHIVAQNHIRCNVNPQTHSHRTGISPEDA